MVDVEFPPSNPNAPEKELCPTCKGIAVIVPAGEALNLNKTYPVCPTCGGQGWRFKVAPVA